MGHLEEGFVFTDRVGAETALVDGTAASSFGGFSPADGVSCFEPVEALGEEVLLIGLNE